MSYGYLFLVIVKLGALILGFRALHVLPLAFKLVLFNALASFIVEGVGWCVGGLMHMNNLWLFNIYAIVQTLALGIAALLCVERKVLRKVIISLLTIITGHWLWYIANHNILTLFNWFFVSSSIVMVISFIVVLIDNSLFKQQRLFTQPLFLMSISYIIYYGTVIPMFGVMNVLTKTNMVVASALFMINMIANILCYVLITVAFYLYGKQATRGYVRQ